MDQKPHNLEHSINRPSEHSDSSEKRAERSTLLKEHKEAVTKEVVKIAEGLEDKETGFETGEVAENLGEGKKVAPTSGFPSRKAAAHVKTAVKALVAPTVEIMQKQIAHAVREQIHILETQARKIIRNRVAFEPFALNKVVEKIR